MQILLQSHSAYKIGMASLHTLLLPLLPALVTVIPSIIRLTEEAAEPRKCTPSVLISIGSQEIAEMRWREEGKVLEGILLTPFRSCSSSLKTWTDVRLIGFASGACFSQWLAILGTWEVYVASGCASWLLVLHLLSFLNTVFLLSFVEDLLPFPSALRDPALFPVHE